MFLEWENNSGKLQIISGTFQNNAINDVKQISLSHVIMKLNTPSKWKLLVWSILRPHSEVLDNSRILLNLLWTNGCNSSLVIFIQERVLVQSVYNVTDLIVNKILKSL